MNTFSDNTPDPMAPLASVSPQILWNNAYIAPTYDIYQENGKLTTLVVEHSIPQAPRVIFVK